MVFLREFHHYLLGKSFHIITDHSSLTWLLQFKEPQGQLARWVEYIFQFQFNIAHQAGKQHLGVRKTISQIQRRFHWPRMSADVKTLQVPTRATCQANKGPLLHYQAALADFRVGEPMDRGAADVMGPFPLSRQENRYILVLVDYFTRWVEAFPLPDQRAETMVQRVVMDFICRFGAPLELHTDQGRNFQSTKFGEVCKLLEIHKTRTTAYHPSSNGLVERFNRTLASMIHNYVDTSTEDWDLYIPALTSAYRGTVHPAMGFTPNILMLGRETTMPVDMQFLLLNLRRSWSSAIMWHVRTSDGLLSANRRSMTHEFHETPIVQAKLWWNQHHKLRN